MPTARAGGAVRSADETLPYDGCPKPQFPITHPDITYKEFREGTPPALVPILLDEYDPTDLTRDYPALVLVHGGAWWHYCRTSDNAEAYDLSVDDRFPQPLFSQHFIVFAIDARLSCDPRDPGLQHSPILPLCGWTARRVDPETGSPGAAVDDVHDAVSWVRAHAGDNCGCWNGKVALLGESSGANLSYQAAATAQPGDPSYPDVVAGWSGPQELDLMSTGVYGCDPIQSSDPSGCWHDTNRYLGCRNLRPDPDCVARGLYDRASPIARYRSNGPPVFFANGGGPTPGVSPPEVIALEESVDFAARLEELGFSGGDYQECIVDTTLHAIAYIYGQACEGTPPRVDVFQSTVAFLTPFVTA